MSHVIRYETVNIRAGRSKRVPVVECCGAEVWCSNFTNTCEKCGANYNWNGSRLAHRSQWGEETGETASDILVSDEALVAALDDGGY